MEISNKTLAWLVVAAIVVSIFGTTLSLMNMTGTNPAGYATSNTTGEARVDVSTAVVLRFVSNANTTNFGSGQIDTSGGYSTCNLMTNTSAGTLVSVGCTGFNATPGALILENVGTSNLNVTLNFSKNESDFLPTSGGRGGMYAKFTVGNGTNAPDAGCKAIYAPNISVWQGWVDLPAVAGTVVNICGNLTWGSTANKILIGLNISVNGNITAVPQTITVYAQGTSI
jgi:hypothetical protein